MKRFSRRHILAASLALPLLLLSLGIAASRQVRVVAIGDVHGAYSEFSAILQQVGLMDENTQWTGGTATLIQTGDVLDRGPQSRACLDLLMHLEQEADRQHGKVIFLLGNHEIMNIMGDLRYVSPDEYRSFADDQSGKVQEANYRDYLKFAKALSRRKHVALSENDAGRKAWMSQHPQGFFEYRDSIGPDGKYGRWLRKHRAIVQVGEGLFLHGGVSPDFKFDNIADLNERIRDELADFDSIWQSLSDKRLIWRYMTLQEALRRIVDELNWIKAQGVVEDPEAAQQMQKLLGLQSWVSVSQTGPIWYRGLAEDPEEKLRDGLKSLLAKLGVQYIVAGHTTLPKALIAPRFHSHVFMIDTGMLLKEYGGVASALEIQDGRFVAHYLGRQSQTLRPPGGEP